MNLQKGENMKKFFKILASLMVILVLPLKLNAESEVKYRWYKLEDSNFHYEVDAESNCEYFLKDKVKYTDYFYSFSKPEEKDGRIIEKESYNYVFNKNVVNKIQINSFGSNKNFYIYEIEVLDKNLKPITYKIGYTPLANSYTFNDGLYNWYDARTRVSNYDTFTILPFAPVNLEESIIRIYYYNENVEFKGLTLETYINEEIHADHINKENTIISNVCDNEVCILDVKLDLTKQEAKTLEFSSYQYKYKDKMNMCYTINKNYYPGYYTDLKGYIKDEEDYVIEKEDSNFTKNEVENIISNKDKEIDSLIKKLNSINKEEIVSKENENVIDKEEVFNKPIAMVTEEKTSNFDKTSTFILIFGLLSFLVSLPILIKYVKLCRKK